MKNIFQFIQKNKYTPWVLFVLLGLLASLSSCQTTASEDKPESSDARSADTYIPYGYVLIPLDIHNAESLTNIVGEIGGVVDLYTISSEFQKSLKIAHKVKLLRAPLNPQQFAVLVKESESSQILSHAGPFTAVIQNPDEKTHGVTKRSVRTQIHYLGE